MKQTKWLVLVLAIAVGMILVGTLLSSMTFRGSFDMNTFTSALTNIGYITAIISGLALAATVTVSAASPESRM